MLSRLLSAALWSAAFAGDNQLIDTVCRVWRYSTGKRRNDLPAILADAQHRQSDFPSVGLVRVSECFETNDAGVDFTELGTWNQLKVGGRFS